jgi:hypothetical protein
MIQSYSTLELSLLMARNGALAVGAVLLVRAMIASLRGTAFRARAKQAFRLGMGTLVFGGLAELAVLRVVRPRAASKGCTRSGADVLCAGPPMVKIREVEGWNVVLDEAAQTLRAERDGVAALYVNTFTSDHSSVVDLVQEDIRLMDGRSLGGLRCVLSNETVTAGGRPGVAMECRHGNTPSRRVLVQRGPHVYASIHCIGDPPDACDPVLRTLEWIRPEDPSLGAEF